MFKIKPIITALSCICLIQTAQAAEFAKEVSTTTVELQNQAMAAPQQAQQTQGSTPAHVQATAWLRKVNKIEGANPSVRPDGSQEFNVIYIGSYRQKASLRTISDVRAMGGMVAQLDAKAKLVKFLNSQVSADIQSSIPQRTPMETEYDKQLVKAEGEINALLGELEEAVRDLDKEKANQIGGISMDDLMVQGIAQSLAARGIMLDLANAKSESAKRIQELQSRITTLDGKLKTLKEEQKKLVGALNEEQTSSMQLLSSMVVTGAVTVNSFESYVDGEYECAVVIVWSPAQERFIRSVLGLDRSDLRIKTTTGKTLNEYVNKINWETVSGGRWIVDKEGVPHLFAVGVSEIENNRTSTQNRARGMAEADAVTNLALSLQSDVKTQMEAQRKVQNLKGKNNEDDVQSASALAKEMKASVKDLSVSGAQTVIDEQRISPLTGRKVHVHVIEYSPLGHKTALDLFDAQKEAAVEVGRGQQEIKGYINESKAQIESARQDAEAYARGAAAARGEGGQAADAGSQSVGAQTTETSASADPKLGNRSFGGEGSEDFQF